MRKIPVCINLDTLALGTEWGLSSSKDPTYKLVDERLVFRLEKLGFKVILFVVGKDLESSENRKFVNKWSLAGHLIGNHSYSHPLNLSSLSKEEIETEIGKTDQLIKEITGRKPRFFNAPGWTASAVIDKTLFQFGYNTDLSPFLSWWIYPILLKQWWSLRKSKIASTVWNRKDIFYPLLHKLNTYEKCSKIKKIPLPVVGFTSIPVWHTGWFVYGASIFIKLLKMAMKSNPEFYYLMHPADVISRDDIPVEFSDKVDFERINISLNDKLKYLDLTLELLK